MLTLLTYRDQIESDIANERPVNKVELKDRLDRIGSEKRAENEQLKNKFPQSLI